MTKKNVLFKNALNRNYAHLARDIINSAREALGGTTKSKDKHAKACGFVNGEQDALTFFATDWAEKLIDLAVGFEEPDNLIEKFLDQIYGPVAIREIPGARPAIIRPHIRKQVNDNELGIGAGNGLKLRFDCI
ncbi:MAG: hypothetical protein GY832_02505 [Chloroflexi bacterium]|nr:hypothetical protein [Chloroflexota bacterium]